MAIVKLREEYKARMGAHYSLKRFNDRLLTYGDLTFKQIGGSCLVGREAGTG
jgi:uncharacterized protein (DUF885 family)